MVLSFKNHVLNPNQDSFKVTKRFKLILFIKNVNPLSRVRSRNRKEGYKSGSRSSNETSTGKLIFLVGFDVFLLLAEFQTEP